MLRSALLLTILTAVAFAQNPIASDSPFQVRYSSNLAIGDSVINMTNTGATGGNICANVYAFSPDEQEVSCCSCVITPDGLESLSVNRDLISNTLTPAHPTSVVVKLLGTTGGACNAAAPGTPAVGLAAWGTTVHVNTAAAGGMAITGGSTAPPNNFQTESGQSIPTGTAGFVAGVLVASTPGTYTFSYGGGGLVPGDTGHGNSTNMNEFWVGPNEATAEAAGHVFCTQTGDLSCGGVASSVGQSFTVSLPAGNIPFGFTFGPNHNAVLTNGQSNNAVGAYLAQIGLGTTPNGGPGLVAYLGLSDLPYPVDADFQDLVVKVTAMPNATSVTESAFTPATLSSAELARISALCGFIESNGSGFGICRSCSVGGLGTAAK